MLRCFLTFGFRRNQGAGDASGTEWPFLRLQSEHFAPDGLIAALCPFPETAGWAILNVLSGFYQCFQPRKLEGPSPTRFVRQGSSPALPAADHQGISARPLRDAEPG